MENIRRQPTGLYIAPPQPRVMQPQQEVLPQRESIAKAIEFEKEPSQKSMRSLLQQLIEEKEHGDKKA